MPPQAASTSITGSPPSAFSTAGESVGSPSPPPPARAPPRTPANANSSSLLADGGTAVAGGSTSPDGGGGSLEIPGDKRSRSILPLVVIVIILASSSSRNREIGDRCSSDADCVSGLSCYKWNGFTGKKCVRTTIANPFNTVSLFTPSGIASSSSRNRKIGDRCSSDADCVSGLSCYNWNGFTGKKCVRTTIANLFNTVSLFTPSGIASSSSRNRKLGDRCSSDADCVSGLSCYNWNGFTGKKCVRTTTANPFNTVDTSLPFNKYAFLTTHNSFSITGVTRFTFYNQEDSVTDQLNNGVRALMLDVYDLRDDIWLCHSFGGKCFYPNAFEPAIYTMREIEAFLLTNPSEIVTLILEDHVTSHHGLSKLFNKTGLMKYWFPVSRMPRDGEDWPRVSDMIKLNHRLLVFTSNRLKESSEEIAYQWNYMVENQYGGGGMDSNVCYNRPESSVLSDRTKSLVLVNYFRTIPLQRTACMEHSRGLVDVLNTCYAAAGNRWANFLAVDYYKRSDGGGVFQAIDMLNGMLICGRNDVRACRKLTLKGALYDLLYKLGLVWKASPMH